MKPKNNVQKKLIKNKTIAKTVMFE